MPFDAKALQQKLANAGYYHDNIDGDFGRRSYGALFAAVARRQLADGGIAIGMGCVAYFPAAQINTPLRIAHFIAQTATETGGFGTLEENLNYSAARMMKIWPSRFPTLDATKGYVNNPVALGNKVYGGRLGNGNVASGDGYRYRGRGLIQLTGRDNYKARQNETGMPLLTQPELASDPTSSVQMACLFWTARAINPLADADNVEKVRKAVNGGTHGIENTVIYLARAKKLFGLS